MNKIEGKQLAPQRLYITIEQDDWINRYGNKSAYVRKLIDRDMNMHEHKRLLLPHESCGCLYVYQSGIRPI